MRTDAPLIKHLYDIRSPEAAAAYNRLPLFVMPEEADELLGHETDILAAAPDELPLPYDDLLLDYPFGTGALLSQLGRGEVARGRMWVRVRPVPSVRQDTATLLDIAHIPYRRDDYLFLEGWEERTISGGLPRAPDHSLVPMCGFGEFEDYLHFYPPGAGCTDKIDGVWCNYKHCGRPGTTAQSMCAGSELIHAVMCRLVVLSLIYLSEGLGGLTTEISYTPRSAREEKTERLKPWLAERRRTYIIIDPARAGEYGHPSGQAQPMRSHSSPIPHSRRGHWRHINPDRKTWVRPAWIGASEWGHEGRQYKIVFGTNNGKK